jgi:hypothetical protein
MIGADTICVIYTIFLTGVLVRLPRCLLLRVFAFTRSLGCEAPPLVVLQRLLQQPLPAHSLGLGLQASWWFPSAGLGLANPKGNWSLQD